MTNEYIAGFFDGEGSVGLYSNDLHKQVMLSVNFSQKIKVPLEMVAETYPGGKFRQNKKTKVWHLIYYGRTAEPILNAMLPHSIVKRPQVELALQFISLLLPKKPFGKGYPKLSKEMTAERERLMAEVKAAKRIN